MKVEKIRKALDDPIGYTDFNDFFIERIINQICAKIKSGEVVHTGIVLLSGEIDKLEDPNIKGLINRYSIKYTITGVEPILQGRITSFIHGNLGENISRFDENAVYNLEPFIEYSLKDLIGV